MSGWRDALFIPPCSSDCMPWLLLVWFSPVLRLCMSAWAILSVFLSQGQWLNPRHNCHSLPCCYNKPHLSWAIKKKYINKIISPSSHSALENWIHFGHIWAWIGLNRIFKDDSCTWIKDTCDFFFFLSPLWEEWLKLWKFLVGCPDSIKLFFLFFVFFCGGVGFVNLS